MIAPYTSTTDCNINLNVTDPDFVVYDEVFSEICFDWIPHFLNKASSREQK